VVVIWWTNRKIVALNRELIKDSREVLVLNGLLQERMNNIEIKLNVLQDLQNYKKDK
jgi:hypothetical protein